MRRVRTQWLLAVTAVGLGAAAALADPGSLPPPGSTSVFSQMMGRRVAPTRASNDDSSSSKKNDKKTDKKPASRPAEDPIAKARAQELANCLRRQEVCLKLMQIAEATSDEALMRKAQELDQRAANAYQRRLSELSGTSPDEELLKKSDSKKPARSAGLFPFLHGGDQAPTKEGTSQ